MPMQVTLPSFSETRQVTLIDDLAEVEHDSLANPYTSSISSLSIDLNPSPHYSQQTV